MHRSSVRDYRLDDLLSFAGALNFRIDVATTHPKHLNSAAMSGRIFVETVQPGLAGTGYDMAYAADIAMRQEMGRSLIVAVLVAGEADAMSIEGVGRVAFQAGRPMAMAMGDRSECSGGCRAGSRCAMAGFVLEPAFFDRFGDDDDDDSLSPLRAMVEGEAASYALVGSPSLSEIAAATLSMPYEGRLGRLFQESATLALVAETARLAGQSAAPIGLGPRQFERMIEAKRLLDESALAVPAIGSLARRVGVSPSTLRAHFKLAFGVSVLAYVRESRMQLSRRLLRSRDLSITEVAYHVGFANPSAFATAFRRRFGHAPSSEAARP